MFQQPLHLDDARVRLRRDLRVYRYLVHVVLFPNNDIVSKYMMLATRHMRRGFCTLHENHTTTCILKVSVQQQETRRHDAFVA